jgi:hypothetical protein
VDRAVVTRRPAVLYLAAGLLLVTLVGLVSLLAPPGTGSVTTDIWAHTAALREWGSDLGDPGHPHLPLDVPSPRFVPPYLPLAALVAAGMGPITALGVGSIFGVLVLLAGVYAFYRTFLPGRPWAPLLGLGVLLFGWGIGTPWSGLFEFRSLLIVAAYPSAWAFGTGLLMVAAAQRAAERSRPVLLVLTGGLAGFSLLTHPPTGIFAFVLYGAVVVAHPSEWRRHLGPVVAIAAGSMAAFAWPWFSLWALLTGGTPDTGTDRVLPVQFYDPLRVLLLLGPLLLGVWALVRMEDREQRRTLLGALALTAGPWLANAVLPVPLGDRFFLYAAFVLQVAVVSWLPGAITDLGPGARRWVQPAAMVLVAFHVALGGALVDGYQFGVRSVVNLETSGPDSVVSRYERVAADLPEDAVVMASESVRWPLPTFAGKVVAVDRETFFVADTVARLEDAAAFFAPSTREVERLAILERWGAGYVVYDTGDVDDATATAVDALGEATVEAGPLRLVVVR